MKSSFLLLSFLLLIITSSLAADLTVSGNLDVQGNVMNLGSWEGQTNEAGVSFNYTDYPIDDYGDFHFSLNRLTATWLWEHLGPNNSWLPTMKLNEANSLALYNSAGQAMISLNPSGNSVFQNSLVINGNNTLLPSQTLSSDGSVLTRILGDNRYLTKSADGKTALGYATASAPSATAMGGDAWAVGEGSIAGGESIASGVFSVALGEDSYASGQSAVALGNNAYAQGNSSFATGQSSKASGNYASAFGLSTIAQGYSQTVIGRYNLAQGNPNSWVATDDLFTIGNGTSDNQRSNAFIVKKNGDAIVKGNATVEGYSYLNDISTDGINANGDLTVWGVSEMMGGAYIGGDLQVTGKIYLQPQGDIPMGQFNQ